MQNDDVGKPGHKRAGELFHPILEETRARLLTSDADASSGSLAGESDNPEGGPAELSDGLVLLVAALAESDSRDPREVLERLRDAAAKSVGLTDLIAEAVAAGDSGDFLGMIRRMNFIRLDAKLDKVIWPSLRRPRRPDVVTYRVRIDLRGAKPPLWRRLELASDLFLNKVNKIIQIAFDWTDTHLHHFASGPGPYGAGTEAYLCPYEVKEGKAGVPEHEVRLDEVLTGVGKTILCVRLRRQLGTRHQARSHPSPGRFSIASGMYRRAPPGPSRGLRRRDRLRRDYRGYRFIAYSLRRRGNQRDADLTQPWRYPLKGIGRYECARSMLRRPPLGRLVRDDVLAGAAYARSTQRHPPVGMCGRRRSCGASGMRIATPPSNRDEGLAPRRSVYAQVAGLDLQGSGGTCRLLALGASC